MRIFIDGLNLLRIESNEYIYQIKLDQNNTNWLKNDGFNQFFSTEKPIDLHLPIEHLLEMQSKLQ